MTTDQWIKKQEEKIKQIEQFNKPLEISVRSMMSVQSNRIFIQGKNSSGGAIGNYKDREYYISPNANKSLPKFPLKGKNGEAEFKNGNKHKTGYFKNFLAFKKAVGRSKRIQTVDLFLTGALSRDWANSEILSNAKARKISANEYVVTLKEENAVKAARYGKVFNLSQNERRQFLKVIQFELGRAMQ